MFPPDGKISGQQRGRGLAAWIPSNFGEACKRHAGRRKLHMRKREARAIRIVGMLATVNSAGAAEWRRATYRSLTVASLATEISKPTLSRDFALVRRIHHQFRRMFGRSFDVKRDRVVWTWNWDHYGFITPESKAAGYQKPVGHFPFDTRRQETEKSYCGFNQLSWHHTTFVSQMSTRELIRAYGRIVRMRESHRRTNVEQMKSEVKQALERWFGYSP